MKSNVLKRYPDDTDLLEDVIIENKQAMEMCAIYSNIISGTMDAFASVISNNLNIVMKFLASITILLSIPTLFASFWGMNVGVPFAESPLLLDCRGDLARRLRNNRLYPLEKEDVLTVKNTESRARLAKAALCCYNF